MPKAFRFAVDEVYIRADRERHGVPIGPMDTLIAAHATSLGAALVTHSRNAFSRVQWLKLEEIGPRGSGGLSPIARSYSTLGLSPAVDSGIR